MEQDIELIENYLNGNLSAEDRSMVEQRLREESQFADRFEIVKNSFTAFDPETAAFENDLQEIHNEFRQKSGASLWWRKNYLIAASLALISLVSIGYFIWFKNPTAESLYLSYLEVPPNNITVRGEQFDGSLERAMTYYEQEDYQAALENLTEVLNAKPDHQGTLFYSGICLLLLGEEQEALPIFQKLEKMEAGDYRNAAKWYLCLTLLKLDQIEPAKVHLEELMELDQSSYARQAEKLLKELNQVS